MQDTTSHTDSLFPLTIKRISTAKARRRTKPLSQCEPRTCSGKDFPVTVLDKNCTATQETAFIIRSVSPCYISHRLAYPVIPTIKKPRKGPAPRPCRTPTGDFSDSFFDQPSRCATPTLRGPSTPVNGTRMLFFTLSRKPRIRRSPKPTSSRPLMITTRPELPRSYTKGICGWEVTPL